MHFLEHYRHWRYKNTSLLLLSITLFFAVAGSPWLEKAISSVGEWGYAGAIIAGMFSVFTFTTAPALTVLYYFSETHNVLILAVLAGFGSVLGDFLIFSFFKDKIFTELEPILTRLSASPVGHIFHSPYFSWLTPVIGAAIIASPLPDELGVPLLSASKLNRWQFILLSFVLNSVGIFLILAGARRLFA